MDAFLAVFAPLIGGIIAGLLRKPLGHGAAVGASVAFILISAAFGIASLVAHPGGAPTLDLFPFINVGGFTAEWAIRQDQLSLSMVAMVSTVSALIHVYSIGYMAHDETKPRFFAYISLFTFAMLMLVTASNLIQLFFGWEGVGLMSYLLIGYWYDRDAANAAAIKAFIVNRIGDLGFAVGIALTFFVFGSVDFDTIFASVPAHLHDGYVLFGTHFAALEVISILLFIGAAGKSAQIFLHTWLADAMEGPTPISALIHAATMVAAGVFMIVRFSPLISHAPGAETFITVIGSLTLFFAGTVGCVQNDIKRIIAYSTCSQLGYMFLGAGVGANGPAIFHLMDHAFFKALLFLAAGCVIHAVADEQDVRLMGGLRRKLPVTYVLMWFGALALAGIPPFSGYFSKDAILASAYASGTQAGFFGYALGTLTAGLTAFYIVRLILLVFHGEPRAPKDVMDHAHEAPPVMLVPLIPLGFGALASGWLLDRHFVPHAIEIPAPAELAPLAAAIIGLAIAVQFYILSPALPGQLAQRFEGLYRFLLNKWYFDEVYDALLVRPTLRLARTLWHVGDETVIDGVPSGLATLATDASAQSVKLQSGSIALYAFVMLVGLLVLVSLFLVLK